VESILEPIVKYVMKSMVESMVKLVVNPMVEVVVDPLGKLALDMVVQPKPNHDNVCVVHESSIVKNINIDVSNDGGVLVDSDSLTPMPSLEDVTPIVDILQGLQYLNSPHYNSEAISFFYV